MKTIFLIRHGQSEADLLEVHEGRADFPLTELGRRQAAAMAKWLTERVTLDKIFASTLRRAAETAQLLGEAAGTFVCPDPDLMEFDNGLLAGLPRKEAAERYPQIMDLPPDQSVYGQETMLDFRRRAERALIRCLEQTREGETVAIVTHGGMLNQLTAALLKLPPAAPVRFLSGDTAIHCWRITDRTTDLVFANRLEHLTDFESEEK